MKIAVIMPTYNAGDRFESLCRSIVSQKNKIAEFIIVDSSSSDGTSEVAKKYATQFRSIPKKEFDHGSTRTYAAKLASSEILIFLTQDIEIISDETFSELIKPFADDAKIAAIYGKQLAHDNGSFFARTLRDFNYPDESFIKSAEDSAILGIKVAQLSNPFTAYKAENLEEIGFFKQGLIFGEDMYAGGKFLLSGYRLSYCSSAVVKHSHNYNLVTDFRRYFDLGVFLKCESWIRDEFGGPTNDGFNYVKKEFTQIIKKNKLHLLPEFFARNLFKLIGYKLGGLYRYFPKPILLVCSMNKGWWDK